MFFLLNVLTMTMHLNLANLIIIHKDKRLDCMNVTSNSTSLTILERKFQIQYVYVHHFYNQVNLIDLISTHSDGRLDYCFN